MLQYKYWGTIVAAVNPSVRAEVGANFNIDDARRLVVAAMEEAPDASTTGSWLKSKMLALDPSFDERNYGSSSFRVLLSRLPDLIEVKRDRSSSDMLVSLVSSGPPPAERKGRAARRSTAAQDSTAAKDTAAKDNGAKDAAAKGTGAKDTGGGTTRRRKGAANQASTP